MRKQPQLRRSSGARQKRPAGSGLPPEVTGFLGAWQQLLGGEFMPALGPRRGCRPRVPLPQLLPAFIFHFMNGAGTLAQHFLQLFDARLAGDHSLPDGEISQVTLTYGGTSYIRNPAVGVYAADRPDRLRNETTAYSTRFWQYVGPKPTDWIELEALTANAQKVLRSSTPPATGSAPTIKSVIEFADRSVAASNWTLTIPLTDSHGDTSFNIAELDDVEVYFHHRAATRRH